MRPGDQSARDGSGSIRVPKTAEVVADMIRKRIILGELQEGAFLPPESQLMATLAISRPTLREAFRILETERLISVVRGSRTGAKVHRPRVEGVARYAGYVLQAEGTTIEDIYEARLAIEPYVARQLAMRRPPEAIMRLRAEIDRLTEMVIEERYIDFMIGLAEFHRLLVEASGNRTLHFVTRMLQGLVTSYQVRLFQYDPLPADEQKRRGLSGLRSFRKLVDLIEASEPDKAEAHWRLHIINANKAWVPAQGKQRELDVFGV